MSEILTTLTLIFAVSSILIFLLERLSHPTIPAYILAGILLSNIVTEQQVLTLSQLGIAFLVFIFGIKTDLDRIRNLANESVATAVTQLVVVGMTAYLVANGFGFSPLNSLYLAAAAAFSSSLVGLELIEGEVRIDILHGRLAESIQLIQDLIALALISVVTVSSLNAAAESLAGLVFVLAVALISRKHVFPLIAEKTGSRELIMLTSLSLLTGFIALSEVVNTSLVAGAFAAGLATAKFPYNTEVLDTMGSLKDFFSAIFFVSLGALITAPTLTGLVLVLVLVSATVALKPLVTALLLMVNGYDKRTSYLAGIGLDQVSEFSLILSIQAFVAGTIAPEIFHSIILAAVITMIISSYTSRYEEEIYSLISRDLIQVNDSKIQEKIDIDTEKLEDHTILLGYDTQGKKIADALAGEGEEFVVVENDPEKIIEAEKQEENYLFGDAMDSNTWRKANAEEAKLIISTIPVRKISEKILSLDTEADVILRSSEVIEARQLLEQGALYVNVPDILSSEELVEHLRGVSEDINYREELRRRNLLEIRKYLQDGDQDEN